MVSVSQSQGQSVINLDTATAVLPRASVNLMEFHLATFLEYQNCVNKNLEKEFYQFSAEYLIRHIDDIPQVKLKVGHSYRNMHVSTQLRSHMQDLITNILSLESDPTQKRPLSDMEGRLASISQLQFLFGEMDRAKEGSACRQLLNEVTDAMAAEYRFFVKYQSLENINELRGALGDKILGRMEAKSLK